MTDKKMIVLAAGGTGGHIFPAEALTEELMQRGHKVALITDNRFADYSSASMQGILGQIPIYPIRAGTLGGKGVKRLTGGFNIVGGIMQARSRLKNLNPDVVVGFGGYPSFPTMMAATNMGLPTVIHEQNSVLGKANRVLARRVTKVACSFEDTGLIKDDARERVALVGNPVRSSVRALHDIPSPELTQDGVMKILVMGGSQGASVFGNVVPEAVGRLPEVLRQRIRIDQQVREEQLEKTREKYQEIGVQVDLSSFFTDVPARLASSHLVISRSGASTVAELTCAGRPAILVPYPSAADDHQTANANAIDEGGGAWLMPQDAFTPDALAARLESFLTLPASLTKAAEKSRALGRPEAAGLLADMVLQEAELSQKKTRKQPNVMADNGKIAA